MHEMAERQVVLLGETHTIAEIHRWQLHVATIIRFIRRNVAVGFEMFPRRVQPVLDEWVAGELSTQQFLDKVDWKNVWGYDPQLICRSSILPAAAGPDAGAQLQSAAGYARRQGWDGMPCPKRSAMD